MSEAAEQYLEALFAQDQILEQVKDGIRAHEMPEISIAPGYGRLLTLLMKLSRSQNALEIGALGGYSGICIARGLPENGKLISLELRQEYADVAGHHLHAAGLQDRVEYRIGEALNSLQQLEAERKTFDFFFIDADKGNYPNYLEWSIRLANPGAIIVGDNALLHGRVMDTTDQANMIRALRKFNEQIATDSRLESTILPAYDGLAIARVK